MMSEKATIWKYALDIDHNTQAISMPSDAILRHTCGQDDTVTLWFEVIPFGESTTRWFRVYGTGWPIDNGDYLGTAIIGDFVWHVYEVPAPCPADVQYAVARYVRGTSTASANGRLNADALTAERGG